VLVAVLMVMVVLADDRRSRNVRVHVVVVLAKNRPVNCPKVAHKITLASAGIGTLTWTSVPG
jgi:hypothetical protein